MNNLQNPITEVELRNNIRTHFNGDVEVQIEDKVLHVSEGHETLLVLDCRGYAPRNIVGNAASYGIDSAAVANTINVCQ